MKILVVDDSIVFRSAIVQAISGAQDLEVVRSLVNGKLAVDFLAQNRDIDLITLDMEMPVMDGMETIKEIRKFNKSVTIIVFSSLTQKGAEKTIEALNAGANDFVTKPETFNAKPEESVNLIREELLPKILAFKDRGEKKVVVNQQSYDNLSQELRPINPLIYECKFRPKIIAIGSSTGGPEALAQIFKHINGKINVPILIVQHMPPIFTLKLAEMLNKLSEVEVREAKDGDRLLPGLCLIAPGDYHMTVDKEGIVHLDQREKVCYVRPSVDVLFNSLSENFKGHIMSIILTGMGEDGAVGSKKLFERNADIFVQDKDSSVVWGMPGSVKRQVDSAKIIALSDVGSLISKNAK
jgi:two-component system chemotaxis response regulator CheB